MKHSFLSGIQRSTFQYIYEVHRSVRGLTSSFISTVAASVYSLTMFSERQRLNPQQHGHITLLAASRRNLHLQYRRFTGYDSLFSDKPYLENQCPRTDIYTDLYLYFSVILRSCHFFFKTTFMLHIIYWLNI